MTARFDTRRWARWAGSFIGFPLAGLAAKAVAGPIDSTTAALLGGAAAGATLGAVQSFALRADARTRGRWIAATAAGMATGLAFGATVVDFAFDATSLVTMGAVTGAAIGAAQAAVLPASPARRGVWAATSTAVWALGWLITSQVIVDADARWANFGASGALVATMIGGLVLAADSHPAAAPDDRHAAAEGRPSVHAVTGR